MLYSLKKSEFLIKSKYFQFLLMSVTLFSLKNVRRFKYFVYQLFISACWNAWNRKSV